MAQAALAFGIGYEHVPTQRKHTEREVREDVDPMAHAREAIEAVHPIWKRWQIDSTLKFALDILSKFKDDIVYVREAVTADIELLREELESEFKDWLDTLPEAVRPAFQADPINAPLFVNLLKRINYPDADQLFKDLSTGFDLVGKIPLGVGWPISFDNGPTHPNVDFADFNDTYIKYKLQSQTPTSTKWDTEVIEECEAGRMRGPFEAPTKWGIETIDPTLGPEGPPQPRGLSPAPEATQCHPAVAFPISQIGSDGSSKLRRVEDWLRSGANLLAETTDSPVHYGIDHQIECIENLHEHGFDLPVTWGVDHEGAYRALPAKPPHMMWMLLLLPEGPSLWQHLVLMFGSKAAVWAYNRFGDGLMYIGRIFLAIMLTHYVDCLLYTSDAADE